MKIGRYGFLVHQLLRMKRVYYLVASPTEEGKGGC